MRKILIRGLFCISGILLPIAVGELYLQFFYLQPAFYRLPYISFPCFEKGAYRWAQFIKGKRCTLSSVTNGFPPIEVQINKIGLRNPEIEISKKEEVRRILFIGDSFTMGWGVEENQTFPRLVESNLNHNSKTIFESINAGFPVSGVSDYYLYLKNDGLKLNSDITIVGFYLGNDITDLNENEWIKADNAGLPEIVDSNALYIDHSGQIRRKTDLQRLNVPMFSESKLVGLFYDKFFPYMRKSEKKSELNETTCLFKVQCHDLDSSKHKIKSLFLAIKKLSEGLNQKLIVVLIPAEFQIYSNMEDKYNLSTPLSNSDKHILNNEFIQFFNENEIDYVDLLPVFYEHRDKQTYFSKDDHWNALGHQIAAEAITKKILQSIK